MNFNSINTRWVSDVQGEALKFVSAVQARFTFGMNQAEKHLPDPKAYECRAQQVDIFIEALIGVCVNIIGTYLNANPDTEVLVHNGITRKFNILRDLIAESKAAKENGPLVL